VPLPGVPREQVSLFSFEALVVEDKAFDDEFAEFLGGPDAEPGGHGAFDPVADGDAGVEIVILHRPGNLPVALLSNC
jgi:hypothetical protein